MKKINLALSLSFVFSILIIFSSCKRNDPIIEDDQEEFDNIEIIFTNLEDPSDIETISFDKNGKSEDSYAQLLNNGKYAMQINVFHDGENINQEFIDEADEHKFFFLAPSNAVSNYIYKDDDLGLTGEISFGDLDTKFDLTILLRHSLDKTHPSAKNWNSRSYQEAGGVDDLRLEVPIQLANK